MFLLKARHGYREGDQAAEANRVSINFQMPGVALPLAQFQVIENEPRETIELNAFQQKGADPPGVSGRFWAVGAAVASPTPWPCWPCAILSSTAKKPAC